MTRGEMIVDNLTQEPGVPSRITRTPLARVDDPAFSGASGAG
jgi:hypothetical protein